MSLHTAALPSLDATLGAAFIGFTLSAIFFGITTLQSFLYYRRFPNDRLYTRIGVHALWIINAVHLALVTHALYYYIIEGFRDPLVLTTVVWSLKHQNALTAVIVMIVQTLYIVRLWMLGKGVYRRLSWMLSVIILTTCYAIGIWLIVGIFEITMFSDVSGHTVTILVSLATATTVDFIIAMTMCFFLQRYRSLLHFSPTTSRITILIRYILCSGVATSTCSMAVTILFVVMPDNLIWQGVDFLLPLVYINSYLAMLNARQEAERISQNSDTFSLQGPSTAIEFNVDRTTDTGVSSPPHEHPAAYEKPSHSMMV